MNQLNKHLIKAIDNYPYNLEECIEGLQYALSSHAGSAMALCLMGRIYSEQFKQYDIAKSYFQEAMNEDMQLVEMYPYYIYTLIENEDKDEAERLLDFAFTLKGINKGWLWWLKIYLLEKMGQYDTALENIPIALCEGYSSDFISNLEEIEKRLQKKKDWKKKIGKKTDVKKKEKNRK